jgi:phage tail protein X
VMREGLGMIVYALQNDTVDAICQRIYGATVGRVEAVLEANRGLAALGCFLPMGTALTLPDAADVATSTDSTLINLWD